MSAKRSAMVDWDLAVSTAATMAGPGPSVSAAQAAAVVRELREGAERSTSLVREYTGLAAAADAASRAPLLVVDRPGWIQANADGFATILTPLIDRLQERKGAPNALATAVGSRVTGLELGGLLGFMSRKVLGQFDPFYEPRAAAGPVPADGAEQGTGDGAVAGRLRLVAPNSVDVESELRVDPHDFRLWVCLHEETHRVQFTAVPWMRGHIHGEIANLVDTVQPDRIPGMLGDAVKRLGEVLRGGEVSLIDLLQSPEQKEVLDRITAVMSLLEGHADVVMDGVGPEVIPSVGDIRRKFNQRRRGAGGLDRILRRLLGLDAKMAQYRDGARFVRGAVAEVGMDGFNKVWVAPENLPTRDEIADPASWVRRVHG